MIELLLALCLVTAWLLPTIVASSRGMPNVGSVAVIDVLLGWTVIGWIVALAMACGAKPLRYPPPPPGWDPRQGIPNQWPS